MRKAGVGAETTMKGDVPMNICITITAGGNAAAAKHHAGIKIITTTREDTAIITKDINNINSFTCVNRGYCT